MASEYRKGDSLAIVADRHGCSETTVKRLLVAKGVEMRRSGAKPRRDTGDIAREYEAGDSMAVIARRHRCSVGSVAWALKAQSVPTRPEGGTRNPNAAAMAAEYAAGATLDQIVAKYGTSIGNVSAILRRRGVTMRKAGQPSMPVTAEQRIAICAAWDEGRSVSAVGEQVGMHHGRVRRVLIEEGRNPLPRMARGERSGRWTGGRRVNSDGYVLVALRPDDPYASMMGNRGYVLEHRLVMARALGRPLLRTETVHHINDQDRSDNRLENLQLRQGQHGNGAAFRCLDCGSANVEAVPLG